MYFKYRADLVRNILMAAALSAISAPTSLAQGDWSSYGGDAGNTRYSPLTQITPANVSTLKPVWTWDSGESAVSYEITPLVIGHVMYVSTPRERVVALDADTGKEIWSYDLKIQGATHRGVAYWAGDSQNPARLIVGTTEGQIYALDAKKGTPIASFGDKGVVNYRAGFADKYPNVLYAFSSPPAIYKNLIIFGPRTAESGPKGPDASIRALDVRTGKEVWTFHTLPRPGEPGYETWGPDFWKNGAGPSAWAGLTVDKDRGMVFVPVGNPTGGGDPAGRKGSNLYSNSVVALNAETGKLIWYYQMVHHDVWDYDVTASPTLINVVQNGKTIPAVAQITKNGLLFILNRLTGQPIFGAEERPVPASKTPGEELSPTQPFPLKPVPLARNSMSAADISHISPASESYCAELVASHDVGGPFIARSARGNITFPSSVGGGNWGGVSYDPSLRLIFVNTSNLGSRSNGPRPGASGDRAPLDGSTPSGATPVRPVGGGGTRFVDQDHYPCNRPPWGQLTAVNANTGDIAWQVTLGSYKTLEEKGIKDAGAVNAGGSLVTAGGVLFIGATNDQRFRAFDARNGKLLWQTEFDTDAMADPMTYLNREGKQLVAIATGGPGLFGGVGPVTEIVSGKIVAFALPSGTKAVSLSGQGK